MVEEKMNFSVFRASNYERNSLKYSDPEEIGCFSIDAESKYCNDGHQMKYLYSLPRFNELKMDLNKGFDKYIHVSEDSHSEYSAILEWIVEHQNTIGDFFKDLYDSGEKVDFVLSRGLLTSISVTIYEESEDWLVYATKIGSAIYLKKVWTDRQKEATEVQKRMATWGFKFEQYMVSDTKNSKPDTSVPVNENEKYFAVFKAKLGHHNLLFSAEMDCVDPQTDYDETSPLRYVELKTAKIIVTEKQKWSFHKSKLLKWYLQSFFAGVPRIICGFRNDEGIVTKVQNFEVKDIPRECRAYWKPAPCLNFTSQFLDHVKRSVVKEQAVYKFYRKQKSKEIICEEGHPTFIPEFYTEKVKVFQQLESISKKIADKKKRK